MSPLLKGSLIIVLANFLTLVPVSAEGKWPALQRHKREWIIAPRQLMENRDYSGLPSIAQIRSDKENFTVITYHISGPGVDVPPVGIFSVDSRTGFVRVHTKSFDREERAFYFLKGSARYQDGSLAEKDIDLKITILDENDNNPVIKSEQVGSVKEMSAAGTVVMKLIATDADQEGTAHTKLRYRIVEQASTAGMFTINSETGEVMVGQGALDRETQTAYRLMVEATDMGGQSTGNKGSGEITINLLDINDNIPTLEKEFYEGSVQENTVNVEVMRIQAIDLDMIHTENWMAEYEIVSGNEGRYFTITTDSKTNEGVIMLNKALDYEELKALNLHVAVKNKAAYEGIMTGASTAKSYPVKINVINQKEGPRFKPDVKVVTISEDQSSISINKVIGNYAAIDSDTLQTATDVRYVKLKDTGNWLIIDEKTADIKLNKLPDRESDLLVNGTYFAEIICITNDSPSKTATGTIAIQVEDFNDHCPVLTTTLHSVCLGQNAVTVTATDADFEPNSAPFDFSVIEERSEGKWRVERLDDRSAILRHENNLWPGIYKVAVEVRDEQGHSCDDVQMMDVVVCTCPEGVTETKVCSGRATKTTELGASGILLLLLGLLLLLLLPLLLLFCLCGGAPLTSDFKVLPFDTKQQLISYHTEGQGEDKEVPLLQVPVELGTQNVISQGNTNQNVNTMNTMNGKWGWTQGNTGFDIIEGHQQNFSQYSQYGAGVFDGMALSDQFLGEYYSSKANHAAQQAQQSDALLVFDNEGHGSLAGSVGCCSMLENDDDLAFLDDLGPKFKTLAGICQVSTLVTESVQTGVSLPPPRPVVPVVVPSTHPHVNHHTETIRDNRDIDININVSTSNESSTVVQEERTEVQVQENIVASSPTILIQQPTMYYTTTPMYVVEPKPQMVLVAGAPQHTVGQVGLSQGLVQVGGLQASQGMVLVDSQVGVSGASLHPGQVAQGFSQGTIGRSQGVVLVESQGVIGGATAQVAQGTIGRSQGVVLLESQGGIGGMTAQVAQGTIGRSRQVFLVENGSGGQQLSQGFVQTGHGSAMQGLEVGGKGLQVQTQSFSLGSRGSSVSNEATPKLQESKRVVVQHKKVSVTEKNIESSSRA